MSGTPKPEAWLLFARTMLLLSMVAMWRPTMMVMVMLALIAWDAWGLYEP